MGYGVHRFVDDIDENLVCGICSAVLEDAVLTPCGHSFCHVCLSTWLARPGPGSCPQCRGRVAPRDSTPILSVRSLIHSLHIHCEYVGRGCDDVMKLECLASHLDVCSYGPVECAGCGGLVNRGALSEHHVQCTNVAALFRGEPVATVAASSSDSDIAASEPVTELAYRITGLEIQVSKIKTELEAAKEMNSQLAVELSRTKQDLELKRSQLGQQQQYVDFDSQYEYGYAPSSIVRLACVIARYLLTKPAYVDADKVYDSIQRCYDNYGRCHSEHELDVLMLLATSNASNWFNKQQKLNIQCWLQCLNRYRQYKNDTHQPYIMAGPAAYK